ncbi:hypothetical protein LTR08_002047 [Meristemomyces frigidus]|nr:hypothetical protein LTR08_002047 [Meristemomyces frigidus]
MAGLVKLIVLGSTISSAVAKCYDPTPAFPVPLWEGTTNGLESALETITQNLNKLAEDSEYDTSSFSVEVTSDTDTLWTHFHTARKQNETRPGVRHVDGDSIYRIASITKTFTTLGILYQHTAGNLSLDDTVDNYIAELAGPAIGAIPWNDITLRIMASQLSGIPREGMAQADLMNGLPDPTAVGLPPASMVDLPPCYQHPDFSPCNRTGLLDNLNKRSPLFAPNQKSTYSNLNFELLGLVLENVTGVTYSEYMRAAIFAPLSMTSTSLSTPPSDDHAVLPLGQFFWDVDQGVHAPTGGIFSSSRDMSKYARFILAHSNALAPGVNWLSPASWSTDTSSFYGLPWEIFRTSRLLQPHSSRPITFVTKSGGVPDYFSRLSIVPEYGLGLTVLVGGNADLLEQIQELVTVPLIRAAEAQVWRDVADRYTGTYTATNSTLNSSIELASSAATGLTLTSFISNSSDVFATLLPLFNGAAADGTWRAQLVPTLLYKNETTRQGEIWRIVIAAEREGERADRPIWDDFCITDVDTVSYAGLPINEVVFWHEEGVLELPAWKVSMKRAREGAETLVVQGGLGAM